MHEKERNDMIVRHRNTSRTFHLVIFSRREQVWMSWGDDEAAHGIDVPGQRQLQTIVGACTALGHVPNLDGAVGRAGDEPLVRGIEGDRSHPAQVTRYDRGQFPRRMPSGRWDLLMVASQGIAGGLRLRKRNMGESKENESTIPFE